jgi:hypothetical protein
MLLSIETTGETGEPLAAHCLKLPHTGEFASNSKFISGSRYWLFSRYRAGGLKEYRIASRILS